MGQIARHLLVFLVWNVAVSAALMVGALRGMEPVGLALSLLLYAGVLYGYLLRPAARRRALLRLRPLTGAPLRWTLAAVPVLLALSWALGEVYVRLVPVPEENFDPFRPLMGTALGRLSITVLAVAVAPVLEEFFFRGLIQRSLELRLGTARGIAAAGLVFAAVHVLPWILPLHLFLGMAFGYAVWATRSIWAGVLLHAANNAAALAGMGTGAAEDAAPVPTVWQTGPDPELWLRVVTLAAAVALAAATARGLRRAARAERLRAGESAP